jgi:hypothetical protein
MSLNELLGVVVQVRFPSPSLASRSRGVRGRMHASRKETQIRGRRQPCSVDDGRGRGA